MRYFLLSAFISISLFTGAEVITTAEDSVRFPAHIRMLLDSVMLRNRILEKYERLEAFNEANEREGRADQNIYVIDPLEDDTYVQILSNNPDDNLSRKKSLYACNERLKEFNLSRRGKHNSGQDKDGTVIYAVLCFGLEAHLKNNLFPGHTSKSEAGTHFTTEETLNAYFSKKEKEKIEDYYDQYHQAIRKINESLIESSYRNRVIYSYASSYLRTPDMKTNKFYVTEDVKIESSWIVNKKEVQASKLEEQRTKIRDRFLKRKKYTEGKSEAQRIREAIEDLILIYEEIMDKDNVTEDEKDSDCKPGSSCWPVTDIKSNDKLSNDKYTAILERFKKAQFQPEENEYTHVLLDQSSNSAIYNGGTMSDMENILIKEKLPEWLHFIEGCKYTVLARFAEVDCEIPEGDRQKFARDVSNHLGYSDDPTIILIVVPYYICKKVYDRKDVRYPEDDGKITEMNSLKFMPAVYSADNDLNTKMNAPFKTMTWVKAIERSLAAVPKKHTAYVSYVSWTGGITTQEIPNDCFTGSANRVDVFIFLDSRIRKMQPHLTCGEFSESERNSDTQRTYHGEPFPSGKDLYQLHLKCLVDQKKAIDRILSESSVPKWELLTMEDDKPHMCTIRQSKLMGNDGGYWANAYVWAEINKAKWKFFRYDAEGSGKINYVDYDGMPNELFYGNNPFHPDLIEMGLEIATVAVSLFSYPVEFVAEAALLVWQVINNKHAEAKMQVVYMVLPMAMVKVGKGVAKQISGKTAKALTNGDEIPLMIKDNPTPVIVLTDIIKDPGASDISVATGIMNNMDAIRMLNHDTQLDKAINESFFIIEEGKLVPNPDLPPGLLEQAKEMANDPVILDLYTKALKANPNLKFHIFISDLKKVSSRFDLGTSAERWAPNLKQEPGWVDLVVDEITTSGEVIVSKTDGRVVSMDKDGIIAFMKAGGYLEDYPQPRNIRIISKNPNSMGADILATWLGLKLKVIVKSHIEAAEITAEGLLKMKGGGALKWNSRSGRLPIPDKMFPETYSGGSRLVNSPERVLTFMPHELDNGNVLCMIDGKQVTFTPDQVVELLKQKNLRGDVTIWIGFPNNVYYNDNYAEIQLFAEALQKRIPNRIEYPSRQVEAYMTETGSYQLFRENSDAIAKKIEYLHTDLVIMPEKQPFVLLTEKNHTINHTIAGEISENKNTLFLVVEEISNGKVKVMQNSQFLELSFPEFYRILKTALANDILNKNLAFIAGAGDEESIQKFIVELAQNTKVEVKAGVTDLKATEDIITQGIKFTKHVPMSEGLFHLRQRITDEQFWKILTDPQEFDPVFVEKLGLELKYVNYSTTTTQFESKVTGENYQFWIRSVYNDYKRVGKISLATHESLHSAIGLLRSRTIPDPWKTFHNLFKTAYERNPTFAQRLHLELISLDPEDLALLKTDKDLISLLPDFFIERTMKNEASLPHFIALEKTKRKLPNDLELIKAIDEGCGNDTRFATFMFNEILDKFSIGSPLLDDLKRCMKEPGFLADFHLSYKFRRPDEAVDLPLYTLRYAKRNAVIKAANDPEIVKALSVGGPPEDQVVLEALERLVKNNTSTRISVPIHKHTDGNFWILRRGNEDGIEIWMKAEPEDIAEVITQEIRRLKAEGIIKEVEIISCAAPNSLESVQRIADNLPTGLTVRAPGSGDEFAKIGVGKDGEILTLGDEPVHMMEFSKGAPPKKGAPVKKAQQADDAKPLGDFYRRIDNNYTDDPTRLIFESRGALQTFASALPPRKGYFDFFSKVEGDHFIGQFGSKAPEKFSPDRVASMIKDNQVGYKENTPLRLILDGDEKALQLDGPVQRLINRMDVPAEIYRPGNSTWMHPTVVVIDKNDELVNRLAGIIKQKENQIDAFVHGDGITGMPLEKINGVTTPIQLNTLVDRLLKSPAISARIKEGKPFSIRLLSCCSSTANAAQDISREFSKRGINIELIAPNIEISLLADGKVVTHNFKGGEWRRYKDGKPIGIDEKIEYVP